MTAIGWGLSVCVLSHREDPKCQIAAVFTMSFMVRGMQVVLVAQSTFGEKRGAPTQFVTLSAACSA